MKINAKLHSLSHSGHSTQHLPWLGNFPKPCQDSLIKPTPTVAKERELSKTRFCRSRKTYKLGWLHPQKTHSQVKEQFWKLNGKYYAKREQRK